MTGDKTAQAGLIEEKQLSNRMRLRLFDRSRRLAGDRWLILLHGEARIIPAPELFAGMEKGDPELAEAIRKRLGGELIFTIDKERRFVAEEEKQEAFAELLGQVNDHMLAYLANPVFPEKLLRRRWDEMKARLLIEREQERLVAADGEDDEGPADFSFCFRDGNSG